MLAGFLAVVYLTATNLAAVQLHGFGAPLTVPLGSIVLGAYGCGLLTIGSWWRSFASREKRGEVKKVEWEKQDVKLMKEVASDQVKLLEAKIATLEVALNKALKKKES